MKDLREIVRHELGKLGLDNKSSQVSSREEFYSLSDSSESDSELKVEENTCGYIYVNT